MYPTKLSCLIYSLLEVVSMCQELSAVDHRLTQMASLLQSFGASFLRSELMNHPVYLQSGLGATTCLHICISRNLKGWGQWVLQKLLFCTRLGGIAFPSSRKSFLISAIMPISNLLLIVSHMKGWCSQAEPCSAPAIGAAWEQVYSGGPALDYHLSLWPEGPKHQRHLSCSPPQPQYLQQCDFWHIICTQNVSGE